jgi:hypothetical protein
MHIRDTSWSIQGRGSKEELKGKTVHLWSTSTHSWKPKKPCAHAVLCSSPGKTGEGGDLSRLTNFQVLHKQDVMAKTEL